MSNYGHLIQLLEETADSNKLAFRIVSILFRVVSVLLSVRVFPELNGVLTVNARVCV